MLTLQLYAPATPATGKQVKANVQADNEQRGRQADP